MPSPPPIVELRPSVVNWARDKLRNELAQRGYEPGEYGGAEAQRLLHDAVQFYAGALEESITGLIPFHSMGELMARYELFLRETGHISQRPQSRDRNVLAVASRFLVELGAARPPKGARPLTTAAYEHLLAMAAELVNRGIYSDLLHTGVIPVHVWVDDGGWLSTVIERERDLRLVRFVQRWSAANESHVLARWQHRPVPDAVMLAEFGVTYDDLFAVYDAVRQAPGALLRTTRAETLRGEIAVVNAAAAHAMMDHFTLGPRQPFAPPAPPFRPSDVFPWAFGRRLSYLQRPIVRMTDAEGTEWCAWTEMHIDSAMLTFFASLRDGRHRGLSPELDEWSNETRQVFASMLNDEVADEVRRYVPRHVVWDRVRNVGGRPVADVEGADLGDIDVLAIDLDGAVAYPLEVKNFAVGLTPRGFNSSVERLQEAASKHGRRVAWVQANLSHVVATAGGDPTREWQVEPMIVLDEEVPGRHLEEYEIPVTTVGELRERLAATGSLAG